MPYTYYIHWTNQNKSYYGVRYANDCHPDDLFVSYFTSSKYVKKFIKQYGLPDIIQVRKIFQEKVDAVLWEARIIQKMNMVKSPLFLNRSDGNGNFLNLGGYKLKPRTIEHRQKISKANTGKRRTDTWKARRSKMTKGKLNPNYGKKACVELREKLKISHANQTRPFIINNVEYTYLQEGMDALGLDSKPALHYRLKSRSEKFKDWYFKDVGRQEVIPVKRPDVTERNKSKANGNK
jgi:hypothetical protein